MSPKLPYLVGIVSLFVLELCEMLARTLDDDVLILLAALSVAQHLFCLVRVEHLRNDDSILVAYRGNVC